MCKLDKQTEQEIRGELKVGFISDKVIEESIEATKYLLAIGEDISSIKTLIREAIFTKQQMKELGLIN